MLTSIVFNLLILLIFFSDEEDNLRDRIRELEARNAELEKLATLAKEERKTFNYGKLPLILLICGRLQFSIMFQLVML